MTRAARSGRAARAARSGRAARAAPPATGWRGLLALALLVAALAAVSRLPAAPPAVAGPAAGPSAGDASAPVARGLLPANAVAIPVEGGAYVILPDAGSGVQLAFFAPGVGAPAASGPQAGALTGAPGQLTDRVALSLGATAPAGLPGLVATSGPALALCDPAASAWGAWLAPRLGYHPAAVEGGRAVAITCDARGGVALAVAGALPANAPPANAPPAAPADAILWTDAAGAVTRIQPPGPVLAMRLDREGGRLAAAFATSGGGGVDYRVALYRGSGGEAWQVAGLEAPPHLMVFSPGGRWLAVAAEDRIVCLDTVAGATRWRARAGPWVGALGVDDGGRVAAVTGPVDKPCLLLFDVRGRRSWARTLPGSPVALSFPAQGGIIVAHAGGLEALDARGRPVWQWRGEAPVVGAQGNQAGIAAVFADGTLCVVAAGAGAAGAGDGTSGGGD